MNDLIVQDLIVAKLLSGQKLSVKKVQQLLNEHIDGSYCNRKTRKYMRELEHKLLGEGILIESSAKGYYIPTTQEEAEEGLRFIHKQALSLFNRYNERFKLYQKIFPGIIQLSLELEEGNKNG